MPLLRLILMFDDSRYPYYNVYIIITVPKVLLKPWANSLGT